MIVGVVLSGLWAQFVALATTVILLATLSKLSFVRALFRRNVSEPFRSWLHTTLEPTNERIDGVNSRLYELAQHLDYEFSANGGGSLRDRVNEAVQASGGPPDPLKAPSRDRGRDE